VCAGGILLQAVFRSAIVDVIGCEGSHWHAIVTETLVFDITWNVSAVWFAYELAAGT